MRIPSALLVIAAVVLAFPFAWGLGLLAAYLIAGPNFGQLPAATVAIALSACIVFAILPSISVKTRFTVTAVGAAVSLFLSWIRWPV